MLSAPRLPSLPRRLLAAGLLAGAALGALAAGAAEARPQVQPKRPNILVLFFDDLRFDTFSYRGGPVATPNIDALAAQSTRFDSAITTTGLCSPSRAAFFTGRWGHRTGLEDNLNLWHSKATALDREEGGILRAATRAGYTLGFVGKWHLGTQGPQLRGASFVREFDEEKEHGRPYTPYDSFKAVQRYKAGARDPNGEKHQYYQTLPGSYEQSAAAAKVRAGQEFIRSAAKGGKPFFAVVSFQQPHPPYRVPEPYASMFDPDKLQLPANQNAARVGKPLAQEYPWWPWHDTAHLSEADWRKMRAKYYGAVAMIDRAVGEIIATAKAEGVYDDLHIVLLGDQGSMLGEHGLYDKAAYAYDELMRIPLLMRAPGHAPQVIERQVSLIDIPATIFDWMGVKSPKPLDGRSLARVIAGKEALAGPDEAFYAYEWYNGAWFGLRAIRTPGLKYVWNPADTRDELYDLHNDPGETRNVFTDPARRADIGRLRARLLEHLRKIGDPEAGRLAHEIARDGR